jgi:hypothetical protein
VRITIAQPLPKWACAEFGRAHLQFREHTRGRPGFRPCKRCANAFSKYIGGRGTVGFMPACPVGIRLFYEWGEWLHWREPEDERDRLESLEWEGGICQ